MWVFEILPLEADKKINSLNISHTVHEGSSHIAWLLAKTSVLYWTLKPRPGPGFNGK